MSSEPNYIELLALEIAAECDDPAPDAKDFHLYRIYALLALTTGKRTNNEHVHDAWSVWMSEYMREHWSIIPFDQLAPEKQEMDAFYRDAILRVVRRRAHVQ
jgi:hypothetical protein